MYPEGTCVKTVLELLNADTGEKLMRDGIPLTAEKEFYPERSGEETVTFSFDSTGFGSIRIGLRETNYVLAKDTWVPCAKDSFMENKMQILTHVPKPDEPAPTPSTAPAPSAAPGPSAAPAYPGTPAPRAGRPGSPVRTGDASNVPLWCVFLLLSAAGLTAALRYREK